MLMLTVCLSFCTLFDNCNAITSQTRLDQLTAVLTLKQDVMLSRRLLMQVYLYCTTALMLCITSHHLKSHEREVDEMCSVHDELLAQAQALAADNKAVEAKCKDLNFAVEEKDAELQEQAAELQRALDSVQQSTDILRLESQLGAQQQQHQQSQHSQGVEHRSSSSPQQHQQRLHSSSNQRDASPAIASGTSNDSSADRHSSSSGTNRTSAAGMRQRTALQERSANTTAISARCSADTDTSNNHSKGRLNVDADCRHKQSQHRSSTVKRSTTTTAATHGNHDNDGDSDGSCNRENNNCSAGSSAHSNDSDVLGGVSTNRHSMQHITCDDTHSDDYARTEGAMRALESKLYVEVVILVKRELYWLKVDVYALPSTQAGIIYMHCYLISSATTASGVVENSCAHYR
eukprot:15650-Heterococcus_DN1.PRE.1